MTAMDWYMSVLGVAMCVGVFFIILEALKRDWLSRVIDWFTTMPEAPPPPMFQKRERLHISPASDHNEVAELAQNLGIFIVRRRRVNNGIFDHRHAWFVYSPLEGKRPRQYQSWDIAIIGVKAEIKRERAWRASVRG